jgi:hypothetical protein
MCPIVGRVVQFYARDFRKRNVKKSPHFAPEIAGSSDCPKSFIDKGTKKLDGMQDVIIPSANRYLTILLAGYSASCSEPSKLRLR